MTTNLCSRCGHAQGEHAPDGPCYYRAEQTPASGCLCPRYTANAPQEIPPPPDRPPVAGDETRDETMLDEKALAKATERALSLIRPKYVAEAAAGPIIRAYLAALRPAPDRTGFWRAVNKAKEAAYQAMRAYDSRVKELANSHGGGGSPMEHAEDAVEDALNNIALVASRFPAPETPTSACTHKWIAGAEPTTVGQKQVRQCARCGIYAHVED